MSLADRRLPAAELLEDRVRHESVDDQAQDAADHDTEQPQPPSAGRPRRSGQEEPERQIGEHGYPRKKTTFLVQIERPCDSAEPAEKLVGNLTTGAVTSAMGCM
jgi:hypothetical protein